MTDDDKDRSAITGRYVSDEYADEHPDTTVSEHDAPAPAARGERGPTPGDWRCNAPGELCVNQRRCDRHDKCCWETDEALQS